MATPDDNNHAAIPMRMQHSCSHCQAICSHRFKKHIELRTQTQPLVAEHRGGTDRVGTTPAATAAQARYLSSSAAATLHGKTHGFVLRLPPQRIAHATCMQPLQCDLQPQIQETHRTTHTDTTTHCRTQRWNRSRLERLQPQLPHRQGTFHRRLQPLYTELKDRITPQVNFFLKWASMVLAGTGKEGKTKEVVKDCMWKYVKR